MYKQIKINIKLIIKIKNSKKKKLYLVKTVYMS